MIEGAPVNVKDFGYTDEIVANLKLCQINAGNFVKTRGYYAEGDGGEATYLVKTAAEFGRTPDNFGDHLLPNGNIAELQVSGWVSAKAYGLKGDRVTDDSTAEASFAVSPHLFLYFPPGIYRTNVNNGVSNRTYLFAENAIIDGVIHITGTGPATSPPQPSVTWVDNVRIMGTATTTIRFGTFYARNLNVDKIRISEVSSSYLNQTATGGTTGVHLYFGTKNADIGEIVCDSGALYYNFSADQGPVKGSDELPENISVGKITINQTDVVGLVTSETVNLNIGSIVQKNQGPGNVAWISTNDKKLTVGSYDLNGSGATSGQSGIYLFNSDAESSAAFNDVKIYNVPGFGFRTYNTGKVHINSFYGENNRTHIRIQSKVTVDYFEGKNSLEHGLHFVDNFAAGSYVGKANVIGTAGSGVTVSSNDIGIGSLFCSGFASLYGLNLIAGDSFYNSYYEGTGCSQALRMTSTGTINMGVLNINNNTNGIIAGGITNFGYDYAYFDSNGSNSNFVLELSPGFMGKKVRQSTSADRGDNSITIAVGTDAVTQRFATTLTANRTVTFSTSNAVNGDKFRITRTGGGAFNLGTTGTFNNKSLTQNQWADYEFSGSGWYLTGFGSL